jgi:hypothetical protein
LETQPFGKGVSGLGAYSRFQRFLELDSNQQPS